MNKGKRREALGIAKGHLEAAAMALRDSAWELDSVGLEESAKRCLRGAVVVAEMHEAIQEQHYMLSMEYVREWCCGANEPTKKDLRRELAGMAGRLGVAVGAGGEP